MSRDNRLYAAWVVSLIATLGSLYFSEIRHFNPCVLCWFQRICMYPLVVILLVGFWKRDQFTRLTALPFIVCGLGVSTWHFLVRSEEHTSELQSH